MSNSYSCAPKQTNDNLLAALSPLDLVDEPTYCRIRKCSLATVRRERTFGRGCPFVRLGRLIRYRPQDISAFIEENIHGRRPMEAA